MHNFFVYLRTFRNQLKALNDEKTIFIACNQFDDKCHEGC